MQDRYRPIDKTSCDARPDHTSGHFTESYNASTGVLTLSDGTDTTSLTFDDFKGTFAFASDGNGGTDVFDPPAQSSGSGAQTNVAQNDGGQTGGSHVGHGMDFGHDQIAVASNGTPANNGAANNNPANNGPSSNAPASNGSVGIGSNDHFVFQPVNWSGPNHDAPANQPLSGQGSDHANANAAQPASFVAHDAVFDPVADAAHNDGAAMAQFHQIVASAGHLH